MSHGFPLRISSVNQEYLTSLLIIFLEYYRWIDFRFRDFFLIKINVLYLIIYYIYALHLMSKCALFGMLELLR